MEGRGAGDVGSLEVVVGDPGVMELTNPVDLFAPAEYSSTLKGCSLAVRSDQEPLRLDMTTKRPPAARGASDAEHTKVVFIPPI